MFIIGVILILLWSWHFARTRFVAVVCGILAGILVALQCAFILLGLAIDSATGHTDGFGTLVAGVLTACSGASLVIYSLEISSRIDRRRQAAAISGKGPVLTTIATVHSPAEAELLISVLRQAGLNAAETSPANGLGPTGPGVAYLIRVSSEDAEEAADVLAGHENLSG